VRRTTAHALAAGALQRIETDARTIEDGGVEFVVRRAVDLKRKQAEGGGPKVDPFASPEPDLFVADLSPTHFALLNKYNVLDHALLVVTRESIDQDVPLDLADFQALAMCMQEEHVLGFYNGGADAGASQRHKHLQVVRFPTAPRLLRLPLRCASTGIDLDPRRMLGHYEALRQALGLSTEPYNLLVARDWMLLVPRSRADFEGIPVNSLAFAGAFFVRDDAELATVERIGPMAVLQGVTFFKDPS